MSPVGETDAGVMRAIRHMYIGHPPYSILIVINWNVMWNIVMTIRCWDLLRISTEWVKISDSSRNPTYD